MYNITESDPLPTNKNVSYRSVWKSTDLPEERASMILQKFIGLFSRFMDTAQEKQPDHKQQ